MLGRRSSLVLLGMALIGAMLLAVSLAVLLLPSLSWAGVLEWITTTPPCEGPCD